MARGLALSTAFRTGSRTCLVQERLFSALSRPTTFPTTTRAGRNASTSSTACPRQLHAGCCDLCVRRRRLRLQRRLRRQARGRHKFRPRRLPRAASRGPAVQQEEGVRGLMAAAHALLSCSTSCGVPGGERARTALLATRASLFGHVDLSSLDRHDSKLRAPLQEGGEDIRRRRANVLNSDAWCSMCLTCGARPGHSHPTTRCHNTPLRLSPRYDGGVHGRHSVAVVIAVG